MSEFHICTPSIFKGDSLLPIFNRPNKVALKNWDIKHEYPFKYSLDYLSLQTVFEFPLAICMVECCMAVSQMCFMISKCPADLFLRGCKADLSANTTLDSFGIVFGLGHQIASVITLFDIF